MFDLYTWLDLRREPLICLDAFLTFISNVGIVVYICAYCLKVSASVSLEKSSSVFLYYMLMTTFCSLHFSILIRILFRGKNSHELGLNLNQFIGSRCRANRSWNVDLMHSCTHLFQINWFLPVLITHQIKVHLITFSRQPTIYRKASISVAFKAFICL